jgi:hypothetical protein
MNRRVLSSPRRLALCLAAVVAIASCGGDGSGTPAVLPVGPAAVATGDAGVARAESAFAAEDATLDAGGDAISLPAPDWVPPTFEFPAAWADLPGSANAFLAPAGAGVDADRFAALAAALGFADVGAPEVGVERRDGERVLTVYDDAIGAWGFYDAAVNAGLGVECTDDGTCTEPVMPTGLPTEDEARARAIEIWRSAGMVFDDADVTVEVSEWGVWAAIEGRLGGRVAEGLYGYANFGNGGALDAAGGWLSSPAEADSYDLVPVADAAATLADPQRWQPELATLDIARTAEGEAIEGEAIEGEAIEVAPAEGDAGADPAVSEPALGDPAVDPAIEPVDPAVDVPAVEVPAVDAESWVVRIVDVQLVVSARYGEDGTAVFVPTYRFIDADGGWWTADALPAEFLGG